MYKNKLSLSLIIIILSSCGGGGVTFSFSVGQDKVVSTNEDVSLSGSFSNSTNLPSTITTSVSSMELLQLPIQVHIITHLLKIFLAKMSFQ